MRILEADKVMVETGDMVCLHTGFTQVLLEMHRKPDAHVLGTPARRSTAATASCSSGSPTAAWRRSSPTTTRSRCTRATSQPHDCAALPLHEHCLFKLGVNLGEIWYLTELAGWLRTNGRYGSC